ncbi:unnamed protein product [Phytomonas sp. EM1]|nr:unnamed protein product [Phytomonas sp. EM1]|eukprot:CCW62089.1 unnamed protein product [Phytomonas sp. isolate EM1]
MQALQRHVRNAEAKLASEGGANLAAARNSFATLTAEKMHLEREMCGVEKTFKEEFGRFHHEKQYDMREFLKVFGELEIAFASSLKSKGEGLRPLLADLAS